MRLSKRNLNCYILIFAIFFVPLVFLFPLLTMSFMTDTGGKFYTDFMQTTSDFMQRFISCDIFVPFTSFITTFFGLKISLSGGSNYFALFFVWFFEWALACTFVDFFFYLIYSLINFGRRLLDKINGGF